MKNVLDAKPEGHPPENLGHSSIEQMMLAIVRYVRHLDTTVLTLHIKTKLCQLVEAMMKRRDDLSFRQKRGLSTASGGPLIASVEEARGLEVFGFRRGHRDAGTWGTRQPRRLFPNLVVKGSAHPGKQLGTRHRPVSSLRRVIESRRASGGCKICLFHECC